MRRSKIVVWLLLLVFICLVIYMFHLHILFEKEVYGQHWKDQNIHGWLMFFGVFTMCLAMLVYRLFRGERTRLIKYVHMVLHIVALILMIIGYIWVDAYEKYFEDNKNDTKCEPSGGEGAQNGTFVHNSSTAHIAIGYLVMVAIVIQFVAAIFVFVYLYENPKMRLYFAPFHDIFGIWIFLSIVACYLTGIFFFYQSHAAEDSKGQECMEDITLPAYLAFLLVAAILLSPYFEWELVGDI